MLKTIFTEKQLSYFFHIAIIINNIGLLFDVLAYYYLPEYDYIKAIGENLSTVSIFIISLIFISQSLFIVRKNYKKLTPQYKPLTIMVKACISVFFIWLLITDDSLEEQFIIYSSHAARTHADYNISIVLIGLMIMLAINFYQILKISRNKIHDISAHKIFYSILRTFIQKCLIFLSFFLGIYNYEKMHVLVIQFIQYTKCVLLLDLNTLIIIIPISWLTIGMYYHYCNHEHNR